jgi:hypothetical protein
LKRGMFGNQGFDCGTVHCAWAFLQSAPGRSAPVKAVITSRRWGCHLGNGDAGGVRRRRGGEHWVCRATYSNGHECASGGLGASETPDPPKLRRRWRLPPGGNNGRGWTPTP